MFMNSDDKFYLDIGNAQDQLLKGKDKVIYRLLEILPGFLAWLTFILAVIGSKFWPVGTAYFIIIFDFYWFIKIIYLSIHQRSSFNQMRVAIETNWLRKIKCLRTNDISSDLKIKNWLDLYHLVILPFANEGWPIVKTTLETLSKVDYPREKIIIALGGEESNQKNAQEVINRAKKEYSRKFFKLITTIHPQGIIGELPGKGSNETWIAKQAKKEIDFLNISYEKVIVSVFDIDTQIYPQYFACLAYHYLTAEKPLKSSFQPIPLFNNNIWLAPAISRVVALSCSFWHMIEEERPERSATFSSQAIGLKQLVEMNYWNVKNVSEDSRVFFKAFFYFDGEYQIVPIFYPVSMDANLAETFWQTVKNIYRQQRRWGWGVENIPYIIFASLKNKKVALRDKLRYSFNSIDGFWSWATNSIIIFMLGWLPLVLGGGKFNQLVLSYNLPRLTRWIMTLAMVGIISGAYYTIKIIPPRPVKYSRKKYLVMVLQWLIIPFSMTVLGSIPALESQTRLMLGKYLSFWNTPKYRK